MNEDCVGEFVVGQVVVVLRREDGVWGRANTTNWAFQMDATVGHLGVVKEVNDLDGVCVEFPEWDFDGPWWYPAWVLSPVSAGAVAPEALSQMKW